MWIWIHFRRYGNMLSAVICVNFNINDVQEASWTSKILMILINAYNNFSHHKAIHHDEIYTADEIARSYQCECKCHCHWMTSWFFYLFLIVNWRHFRWGSSQLHYSSRCMSGENAWLLPSLNNRQSASNKVKIIFHRKH